MIVRIINPREKEGSDYRAARHTLMRCVCFSIVYSEHGSAYANYCLRAIQLATTIFRANNGPGDEANK